MQEGLEAFGEDVSWEMKNPTPKQEYLELTKFPQGNLTVALLGVER